PSRQHHVRLELNELECEVGEPFGGAVGRAVLNDEILALDVSELSEPFSERVEVRDIRARLQDLQHADTVRRPRPLRLGAERGREKASYHCTDEPSTVHHWLIAAARPGTARGEW